MIMDFENIGLGIKVMINNGKVEFYDEISGLSFEEIENMRTNGVKTWDELRAEFEEYKVMKCVPQKVKKLKEDYVFDEDLTVRQNRELVIANNQKYEVEEVRLSTLKAQKRDNFMRHLNEKFDEILGQHISKETVRRIWINSYTMAMRQNQNGTEYPDWDDLKSEINRNLIFTEEILKTLNDK